jgi:NhaP-type Na+/H+ or K+/H+ antiporter
LELFVTILALIGIVIVVASLLSGAVERSGVPLVAVFLALGAALGPSGLGLIDIGLESPALAILATLALALVLFSDAVTIETAEVRARWSLAWRLLGPGTLAPAAIVAVAARLLLDLPWPAALILGAALASTDPVLLRSLFRSPALPRATRLALRLETGMNDVVLLPVVVFCMLFLQPSGAAPSAGELGRHAFGLLLLGPALGALVGWLGIVVLARVRSGIGVRRDYESLYALGLAFGGYAAAEAVGGSGFLAAFAAGFVVAAQDVELCDCFLEYGEATAEMLLLFTFVAFGTSLVWSGLTVADAPTLAFAAIALSARSLLLLPILSTVAGLEPRDRRLIALFGPRGLSALLLVLLPVFAGMPGAERLFTVACLVVLLSALVHGGGIALFLRQRSARAGRSAPLAPPSASALPEPSAGTAPGAEPPAERIELDELLALVGRNEPFVLVDARAERSYRADELSAKGAVRLNPEDAIRAATAARLPRDRPIVVYCA